MGEGKRRLLSICLLCLFCLPGLAADDEETGSTLAVDMTNPSYYPQPEWFKISFLDIADDIKTAAEQGKHLGLYLYQNGCSYCKLLLEDNFGQYQISEFTKTHFDIIAINIFGALEVTDLDGSVLSERVFAERHHLQFTPTMIFFAPDGRVAYRMNGYYPPHKFLTMLEYIHGRHYAAGEKFIDFMRDKNPQPATEEMHTSPDFLSLPADLSDVVADKPLMVLFEQPRCLACDELHLDIFQRKQTRELLQQLKVVLINIFGEKTLVPVSGGERITETAWRKSLDIKYTPSLVFFDRRDGKDSVAEVFRVEGYLQDFHLQTAMNYVISGAYARQSDFQAFLSERFAASRDKGIDLNIME